MPTIKPRVQVTLEPYDHEVIERLAALQGRTRGAVIADLLHEVVPALARTVALLEAAAEAPEQVKKGLRGVVDSVHDDLVRLSGDSVRQMDFLLSELSGGRVEEGAGCTPPRPAKVSEKAVPADANPHVVTRGSGSGETRGSATRKKSSKPVTARVSADKQGAGDKGVGDARKKRQI